MESFPSAAAALRRHLAVSPIWLAVLGLFVFSAIVAPGTLGQGSILGMLPFAAILAMQKTEWGVKPLQAYFA